MDNKNLSALSEITNNEEYVLHNVNTSNSDEQLNGSSIVKIDTDEIDSDTKRKRNCNKKLIILLVFVVIVIILITLYMVLAKKGYITHFFVKLETILLSLYEENKFIVLLMLHFINFTLFATCIPGLDVVGILCFLVMKNNFAAFVFLTVSHTANCVMLYYLTNLCCFKFIFNKVKDNDFYLLLKEESLISPYKTAFVTKILYLPKGMRDYILILIKNPMKSFFLSSLVYNTYNTVEMFILSSELNNIKELFTNRKSWSEKSTIQKVMFIVFLIVILVTLFVLAYLSYWVTKRLREKKKQRRDQEKIELKIN